MPALCAGERLWLWIITGVSGALFAFLLSLVGPNLLAYFNRTEPAAPRRHPLVWTFFGLAGIASIVGAAFASSAPSQSCVAVSIPALVCAPQGEDQAVAGEFVQLRNDGRAALPLEGWKLCDLDDNHCYEFGAVTLARSASLTVWSGGGSDTSTDLYWNHPQPIWNNDGDVAALRDTSGELIAERPCP